MELAVVNVQGKETGKKVNLNAEIFGVEPNEHAIYLDIKQHLANSRQGTHKSKERGEINRTTKKHHRQKGTGGARYGSLKGPLHRGGGTAFGPRPRDYSFKLNKKLKQVARKSALSLKAKNNEVMILEDFNMEAPKTKDFTQIMAAIGVTDKKSLIVIGDSNKNIYLSSRNIKGVNVVTTSELNTYKIMNANSVVLTEGSIEKIETVLS